MTFEIYIKNENGYETKPTKRISRFGAYGRQRLSDIVGVAVLPSFDSITDNGREILVRYEGVTVYRTARNLEELLGSDYIETISYGGMVTLQKNQAIELRGVKQSLIVARGSRGKKIEG